MSATVLKVSQAVSGEIVLDKLIETLMRIAIEHAGAERGLLILFSRRRATDRGGSDNQPRPGRGHAAPDEPCHRRASRIRAPHRHPDAGKRDP